jgi:hypothetical protein
MTRSDKLVSLACLVLLAFSFAACAAPGQTPPAPAPGNADKPAAAVAGTSIPSPVLPEVLNTIVAIRKEKVVNFSAMLATYEGELSDYVQSVDKAYQTTLDKETRDAIAAGAAGKDIAANKQIAEKSIQRAFILAFQKSLAALNESAEDPVVIARLTSASPITRSVAQRRSEWIGKGTEYPDAFDAAFNLLKKAFEDKDRASQAKTAKQLEALFTKSIVLSVFYELEGLAQARGKNAEEAAEKRAEASMYYKSLREAHELRNKAGATAVLDQFKLEPDKIDLEVLRKILKVDFKAELADVDAAKLGS